MFMNLYFSKCILESYSVHILMRLCMYVHMYAFYVDTDICMHSASKLIGQFFREDNNLKYLIFV